MGRTLAACYHCVATTKFCRVVHEKDECNFRVNNCVYLGHVVGGGQVKPIGGQHRTSKELQSTTDKESSKSLFRALLLLPPVHSFLLHSGTLLTELTKENKEN